jgi:hypothetical protein
MTHREPYPAELKTWADLERASVNDPILHLVVSVVYAGLASKEQALVNAVMFFAEQQAKLNAEELHRLMYGEAVLPLAPAPGAEGSASKLSTYTK